MSYALKTSTIQFTYCYKNVIYFNKRIVFLVLKNNLFMIKKTFLYLCLTGLLLSLTSCFDDNDDVVSKAEPSDINNFIWRGLNHYYLYKSSVPNLANNAFATSEDYQRFLASENNPKDFFNKLLSQSEDRFSFITDDYISLEKAFQGVSKSNGMAFGLVRINNTDDIFGYVRYVMPNSDAEAKQVKRGMIFNRVNNTKLSVNNYENLLNNEQYSIGLATLIDDNLEDIATEIPLNKQELTENPIHITKIIEKENQKIGYLLYNSFTSSFDSELNAVFSNFKAANIDNLIIDLRYNGGGSIETCSDLASMITGQFNEELFITQVYNENFSEESRKFNNKINTGASINSLGLTRVYILTTQSSASASELLISALLPYIDVVQIGEATRGKFQGSITVYDSPRFTKVNVNPNHTYAIQPLILKAVNANGFTDYIDGITPNIEVEEDYFNLKPLGDENQELFLQTAINHIVGNASTRLHFTYQNKFKELYENKSNSPIFQRMYK